MHRYRLQPADTMIFLKYFTCSAVRNYFVMYYGLTCTESFLKFYCISILLCIPLTIIAAGDDTLSVAQAVSGRVVRGIVISGNKKTKDYIITREMILHEGDTATTETIEYDKNRIFSLRLFNRVDIEAVPLDSTGVLLHIDVDERWYIFPIPIFGIKDRDWSRLYYGLGVLHDNFLGENQKLYGACILGYDPFAEVTYKNPRFDSDGDIFFLVHGVIARVKNKSLQTVNLGREFDERHYIAECQVGRRFGTTMMVWGQLSFVTVNVSVPGEGRTISSDGTDRYFALNVGSLYDTRDLMEYPRMGTYLGAVISKEGLGTIVDYWRVSADVRRFLPIGTLATVGMRSFINVAFGGTVPLYDHRYFGYGDRIRGHFKDIVEGESIAGATVEFHVPILNPIFFKVPNVPVAQFATWRFGVVAALFADAGQVWYGDTPVALNRFTKGFGGGFHFLLPYNVVMRTEIGFDEHGKSQFIFDLGAAL
jgi:outer membrane protein assembly factor BamA